MSDYDTDLVVWSQHQSDLLRRMAAGERVNDQVDWENVAEEIESLGRSDRRELRSRVQTILVHLIKLLASPAAEPRSGWLQTVRRERTGVRVLIKDSPSLKPIIPALIDEELPEARTNVSADLADCGEQPATDPATLTFTTDQVLGPWLPA